MSHCFLIFNEPYKLYSVENQCYWLLLQIPLALELNPAYRYSSLTDHQLLCAAVYQRFPAWMFLLGIDKWSKFWAVSQESDHLSHEMNSREWSYIYKISGEDASRKLVRGDIGLHFCILYDFCLGTDLNRFLRTTKGPSTT